MDHLRGLKQAGNLGLRRISQEMEKIDTHQILSKSSLGDLFRKNTLPRNSEQLAVLQVLLKNRYGDEFHPRLIDRYLVVWAAFRSPLGTAPRVEGRDGRTGYPGAAIGRPGGPG